MNEQAINLRPIQFQFPVFKAEEWIDVRTRIVGRLRATSKLRIPHLRELLPHEGRAVIVGSAPSILNFKDEIKRLSNEELDILVSINGAHDWLIKNVRPPNIHVIFEGDLDDVTVSLGGPPHKDTVYYLCSQCHPKIFEQLRDYKRVLFHVFNQHQEYQNALNRYFKGEFMITGSCGTLFRCLYTSIVLGYRKFELFGVDSSFEGESDHIPGYKTADVEKIHYIWGVDEITHEARKFQSNGGLAFQAYEFLRFCEINQSGLSIRVYGDGLLRYIHKSRYLQQYENKDE